jgi:hypothetical protein
VGRHAAGNLPAGIPAPMVNLNSLKGVGDKTQLFLFVTDPISCLSAGKLN